MSFSKFQTIFKIWFGIHTYQTETWHITKYVQEKNIKMLYDYSSNKNHLIDSYPFEDPKFHEYSSNKNGILDDQLTIMHLPTTGGGGGEQLNKKSRFQFSG